MAKTKRTDLSSALKPAPFQQARRTIPAGAIGTQAIEQLGVPSVSPVAADFSQSNQFQQLANLLNATGQLASGLERRNRGKLERQRRDDNELKGEALQDARNMLPTLIDDLREKDPRWDYDPSKPPNEEAARLLRENLITDKTPEVYSDQILNSLVPSISTKIIEIENAKLAKANQESDSRNSYAAAEPGQDLAPIFTAYVQRHAEAGNDKNFFNFYTDVLEPRIALLSQEGETEKLKDLKARIKAAPKGGDDFDYGTVLDPHITRSEQAARVVNDQIDKENVEEVYVRMQAWKEAGKNILFFPLNDHLDDLDIPLYRRIAIGNKLTEIQNASISGSILNNLAVPKDTSEFTEEDAYWKNMHDQGHITGTQLSIARATIQNRNTTWVRGEKVKVQVLEDGWMEKILGLESPDGIPSILTEFTKAMKENDAFNNSFSASEQLDYFDDIRKTVDEKWGAKLVSEEIDRAVTFLNDGGSPGAIGDWLSRSNIFFPNADGTEYTVISPLTGKNIGAYSHNGLMNILYSQVAAKLDADFAETSRLAQPGGGSEMHDKSIPREYEPVTQPQPPSYEMYFDHIGRKLEAAGELGVSAPGPRNLAASISALDPMSQIPEDKAALAKYADQLKLYYDAANTVDPSGRTWEEQAKRFDDPRFKYIGEAFKIFKPILAIQNMLKWRSDFNPSVPPIGSSENKELKDDNISFLDDLVGESVNDLAVRDDVQGTLHAYMNVMSGGNPGGPTWAQGRDATETYFRNTYEKGHDGRWQVRGQQSPEMIHIARSALLATIATSQDKNEYNYDPDMDGDLDIIPDPTNPAYYNIFMENGMPLTRNGIQVRLTPYEFGQMNDAYREALTKQVTGTHTNLDELQRLGGRAVETATRPFRAAVAPFVTGGRRAREGSRAAGEQAGYIPLRDSPVRAGAVWGRLYDRVTDWLNAEHISLNPYSTTLKKYDSLKEIDAMILGEDY